MKLRPSTGSVLPRRRFKAWCEDGTWDRILAELIADADAAGELDWRVSVGSVDSTSARVHQHAATARRASESSEAPLSQQGAAPNHEIGERRRDEPADRAIGRSPAAG